MLHSLLFKEWLKARRLWWVPFIVLAAALVHIWLGWRGIRAAHGASSLWSTLVYREMVNFSFLQWILPLGGLWFACAQTIPECSGRRLRLLFHLPVSHRVSLHVMTGCGLFWCAALGAAALAGFWFICFLMGFPSELARPMTVTLLPWVLASMTTWCATAAAVADPHFIRRLGLALAGVGYIFLLTAGSGFAPLRDALWAYALLCLPWPWAAEASAMRVKEGA